MILFVQRMALGNVLFLNGVKGGDVGEEIRSHIA
jgi:hypothetical protein